MGAVYKGTQKSLDRPVAIKILPAEMEEHDRSFIERFKNEARAMAKLTHPGIVAVYDSGETADGTPYIVMEFIEGTDVARMVAKQGRLRTEHAMAIACHVCDALAYAHERGIIHRDIKPANIMVGYDGVVKVADFGLAKMTQDNNSGLTQSGMALGTLYYMAPESLTLGTAVDHRADIYAVGIMLYQMLTGKLPQGLFELPSLQIAGLDPRFDDIIGRAICEDREQRYQSVLEMRHDLDAILTQPVAKVDAAGQTPAALPTQARPQRPPAQPHQPPLPSQVLLRTEKRSSPLMWAAFVSMCMVAAWLYFDRQQEADTSEKAAKAPPADARPPDSPPQTLQASTATGTPTSVAVPSPRPSAPSPPPATETKTATTSPAPPPPTPVDPAEMTRKIPEPNPQTVTLPVGPVKWTDDKGRTIMATYKGAQNDNVLLEVSGKSTPFPFSRLSAESQALAQNYARQQASSPQASSSSTSQPQADPALAKQAAAARAYPVDTMSEAAKDRVRRGVSIVKVIASDIKSVLRLSQEQEEWVKQRDVQLQTDCGLVRIREAANGGGSNEVMELHGEALRDVLERFSMEQLLTWEAILGPGAESMRVYTGGPYLEAIKQKRLAGFGPGETHSSTSWSNVPSAIPTSQGSVPASPNPAATGRSTLFTNSLGMRFAPVPGTNIQMCIHETRYRDYAVFAAEQAAKAGSAWKNQTHDGYRITSRAEDHPVMGVDWEQARDFCAWLGKKEGRSYRLPTHEEWSAALGAKTAHPWGDQWPPPARAGNFSDTSRRQKTSPSPTSYVSGLNDGFPTTAPVMSFTPNRLGFYDLAGNAWEWCGDLTKNSPSEAPALRGGSWTTFDKNRLLSYSRASVTPGTPSYGFRCVIDRMR